MKVERFLNHIYYSFAAFDRMFSFSSLEYRDGNDMDIIASKLMGLSIVGYLTGLLYVLILLPIRMLGVHIIKLKAFFTDCPFPFSGLVIIT